MFSRFRECERIIEMVELLLNYLKASGLRVGLLINFGSHNKLDWKRFVR